MATAFNLNPAPTSGTNAYGKVPGQLGLPIDTAGLNSQAGADISAKLGGTLSPGTLNALENARASYGVSSGMPGSQLSWHSLYGNIAGASENQQQQGLMDYNAITGPQFQNEVAQQNSVNAAAPDPTLAAQHSEELFNKYLTTLGGRGGGGGSSVTFPSESWLTQRPSGAASTSNPLFQPPTQPQQGYQPYQPADPSVYNFYGSPADGGGYDDGAGGAYDQSNYDFSDYQYA